MATITDKSYFVRERFLPSVPAEVGLPTEAVTEYNGTLLDFATYYEPYFLKLLLGEDLYPEYIAGRTVEGNKWKAFDIYMIDPSIKDSCIADYLFCKYWTDYDTVAASGTLRLNGENPSRISYTARTIPVWNMMIEKVIKALNFLVENYDTYCSEYSYNYDGWQTFVWSDGYELKGNYQNGMGL